MQNITILDKLKNPLERKAYLQASKYYAVNCREVDVKGTTGFLFNLFTHCKDELHAKKTAEILGKTFRNHGEIVSSGQGVTNFEGEPKKHDAHVYITAGKDALLGEGNTISSLISLLEQGKILSEIAPLLNTDKAKTFSEDNPLIIRTNFIKPKVVFWQMDESRIDEFSKNLNAPFTFEHVTASFVKDNVYDNVSFITQRGDLPSNDEAILKRLEELGVKAECGRSMQYIGADGGNMFLVISDVTSQKRLHDICREYKTLSAEIGR